MQKTLWSPRACIFSRKEDVMKTYRKPLLKRLGQLRNRTRFSF